MGERKKDQEHQLILPANKSLVSKSSSLVGRGLELVSVLTATPVPEIIPRNAAAYFKRGHAWYNQGELDRAIADLTKALEMDLGYADAFYIRGLAWEKKGDLGRATDDYTRAIITDRKYEGAYYAVFRIDPRYASALKVFTETSTIWDQTITIYTKPMKITQREALFYCIRGYRRKIERKMHHQDLAIADFTKALEIDPRNAYAYYERGNKWVWKGDYERAISDYTKVVELNPSYADVYYKRGDVWFDEHNLDNAIADFTKGIELGQAIFTKGNKMNPRHTDYLKRKVIRVVYKRGIAWIEKGDPDRAIVDFTKALEMIPRDAWGYFLQGWVWAKKGDHDSAIGDFTKALEIDPRHAWAYYNRGNVWKKKGNLDRAIADCNKALNIDPRVAKAYKPQEYNLAGMSDSEREIEKLLESFSGKSKG